MVPVAPEPEVAAPDWLADLPATRERPALLYFTAKW
jgi:hypothetical protein